MFCVCGPVGFFGSSKVPHPCVAVRSAVFGFGVVLISLVINTYLPLI